MRTMKKIFYIFGGIILLVATLIYYTNNYIPDLRYTYSGIVLDSAGNPIEGVTINFFSEGWENEKAITDPDGKFILRTNMSLDKITAQKIGYKFKYDRSYLKNPHNFIGEKTQ